MFVIFVLDFFHGRKSAWKLGEFFYIDLWVENISENFLSSSEIMDEN